MKPVSNSSVLIALSSIGQLALLRQRFPEGILIPPAVYEEVVSTGQNRAGAREVAAAAWIARHPLADSRLFSFLQSELDHGEAEAIALAIQENTGVVLLDEKDARRAAQRLGLQTLGTVGVLLWAKQTGRIPDLRSCLDSLCNQGRFHLSDVLVRTVLQRAGELAQ